LSGLFIDGHPPAPDLPIQPVDDFDDLYKIRCVKWDTIQKTMLTETFESVSKLSNMVLHNSDNGKNYHIAYIESPGYIATGGPPRNYVTIYVRLPSSTEDLPIADSVIRDGSLSICYANNRMSDSPVDIFSEELSSVSDTGSIVRCIDIRETSSFQRYVDNGKILFRARAVRARSFPVSHDDINTDSFQIVGSKVSVPGVQPYEFDPWATGASTFDQGLDWSKAIILDRIDRLRCTYFKCASK
jgi:hypothetical protein